jgi:hypothetical protein
MPNVREIIGFAVIAIFAVVLGIYLIVPPTLDEGQSAVVNLLIGALIGSVTTVIGFHYGSSAGSKDKDDALIAAAETPQMAKRRVAAEEPTAPMTVTVEKQELEAEMKP